MKSKITSFIMTVITILIFAILIVLGIIIYNDINKTDIVDEVQSFVSNIIIAGENKEGEIQSPEVSENLLSSGEVRNQIEETSNNASKKFFYNQLDNYSKILYDALEKNKDNMKTGTYEINFGTVFSDILSKSNGQEILGDYYQSAIEAYTYDNLDTFYIDFSKVRLNIETTKRLNKVTYRVYLNQGESENYLFDEFPTQQHVEVALNEIEKVKRYFVQNKKVDTYANIKVVHDYLVESIEYDTSVSEDNIYNIYGALVNKKCVCEGYAEAFKVLMDALDIPSVIIIGKATNSKGQTENHAWNYVQINGIWYAIDCTWDDPILIGGGILTNSLKYKYFLKGENEFSNNHHPEGQFTQDGKVFTYPNLSENNY